MSTLKEDLDAFKREFLNKFPKDKAEIMVRADADLAARNVVKNALKAEDKAPDFTLPAACGRAVSLYETLQQGPVIVIFYRGGWCPYCNLELRAYERLLPEIREAGVRLLAISPQKPDESLSTQEKNALAYPVLSDVNNEAARAFGILFDLPDYLATLYAELGHDLPSINGAGSWTLPVPATFVIAQDGTLLKAHVEIDYRTRLEPKEALQAALMKEAA